MPEMFCASGALLSESLASIAAYLATIMTSRAFFIENLFFVCGIVVLLGKKPHTPKQWKRFIGEAVCSMVFWFICWALLRLVDDSSLVGVAADALTLLLYGLVFRYYSKTTRLICGAVYFSSYILVTGINFEISYLLTDLLSGVTDPDAVGVSLCLITVCVVLFLRRWHVSNVEQLPDGFMVLMLTISGLSALLQLYSLSGWAGDAFKNLQLLMLIIDMCFLLIQLMAYYLYYTIGRQLAARMELMALQHKEDLDNNILATARQTYESLSELRHEIKNHDAYMAALLAKEDYEGLKRYFAAYQAENNEAIRFVHSGNKQVDAIVNNRMTRAKMMGVEIETMLAVPEQLPFDEKDLCSLLSNLLDNAIEGCACCKDPNRSKLLFHMRQDAHYLFLHTENPISCEKRIQQRHLSLQTTKDSGALHGYGTKIIRAIAEKYHGATKFQIKENQFVVDVMLLREKETP